MLNLIGRSFKCCDEVTRRSFLQAGSLGLGGLTLGGLLRQRAAGAIVEGTGERSVIYLRLAGGATQFETYDPKPEAPVEYRGPLGAIPTSLPGVYFSEFMQRQARILDKLAIVRSIQHDSSSHGTSSHLALTGHYYSSAQNLGNEMPAVGAVTSKLRGPNEIGMPAYVTIPGDARLWGSAWLGRAHGSFGTEGDPNGPGFRVRNLALEGGLNLARLDDRQRLRAALDATHKLVDTSGMAGSIDEFSRRALEMVTSDRARRAFDLASEDPRLRDAYGRNTVGQGCLLARRLVEAGVAFVGIQMGGWDDHAQIQQEITDKGPLMDQAIATLVEDLCDRGLDRQVLLVVMGEFGRTPLVNPGAGRDHWGNLMSVLLAGGGLKMGQIVGASNARGEFPVACRYRPEHILATVYRHLGIRTDTVLHDSLGRPHPVLNYHDPIAELI